MDTPAIELFTPASAAEVEAVRDIFREYAATLSVDLCFADIPPYYHIPHAGAHYLKVDLD